MALARSRFAAGNNPPLPHNGKFTGLLG